MSAERMRRVDEAVQRGPQRRAHPGCQGPSRRIRDRHGCQDQPRPAPRARLRERARRRRRARGDARGPALRARLPAGPRRRRAAAQAHADARRSSTTTRPTARSARRAAPRRDGGRSGEHRRTRDHARAGARRAARRPTTLRAASRTRTPTATRSARSSAMHRILLALGKDSVMFMAADEFPLPYEYRFFELDGLVSAPPADLDERTIVFLDCGNIDRNPVGRVQARRRAHPQHRPPPRQHALRHASTSWSRTRRAPRRSCGT